MAKLDTKASESLSEGHSAFNYCKNGHEQCTGGCGDDTPGQAEDNVSASVELAYPKRIDSMGGAENRGRDNKKR